MRSLRTFQFYSKFVTLSLLSKVWHLLNDETVTLVFNENETVSGHAQINTYGAKYILLEDKLSFEHMYSTLMAGDPERMQEENMYFSSLRNAKGYQFSGEKLELIDSDGQIILTFI